MYTFKNTIYIYVDVTHTYLENNMSVKFCAINFILFILCLSF